MMGRNLVFVISLTICFFIGGYISEKNNEPIAAKIEAEVKQDNLTAEAMREVLALCSQISDAFDTHMYDEHGGWGWYEEPEPTATPTDQSPHGEDEVWASWYGGIFDGRTAADGSIFHKWEMTAAHKTLPFGTEIKVTLGDKSVVVRITDRGPFIDGRDLDLSRGAATVLGMVEKGVAQVGIEVI